MVTWQVFVGGKQRGKDYDSEKEAITNGALFSKTFRQIFVYRVVNGKGPQQVAKWIDGERVA